ncbi:MAG: hypothetical protein M1817_002111 [Caeruleum heppii]|nr:MAG: hypothetical protein M1817_002111 [Caeruleum heppii]
MTLQNLTSWKIENYGLIGNMRTCALIGVDGGLDFMCWSEFDSPSIFCRLLDKDKGGHFSISPTNPDNRTTKQHYLPHSNVLETRWIHEDGVLSVIDFFTRPAPPPRSLVEADPKVKQRSRQSSAVQNWLIRRVQCIRGTEEVDVEVFPAFNYAQSPHETELIQQGGRLSGVLFKSEKTCLRLDVTIDSEDVDDGQYPELSFRLENRSPLLGKGLRVRACLSEGQRLSLSLREQTGQENIKPLRDSDLDWAQSNTHNYWHHWIAKCKYKGRYQEVVERSLMILKLLTYEPTGAIIASPTFALPEDFGGARNWDYRYSWVRDASFTIYILLRMGFTDEAEAYMDFMSDRFVHCRTKEGDLPIMFSIHGETNLEEIELDHLEGYRASRPVRIGNGAALHKQLDIYGELMDSIYLFNKYGKPVSYDSWLGVRELADHVCLIWRDADMSIWEVRNGKQNFVYSKVMLWVAVDRALRLADKRCFPCPKRQQWLATRDEICEEIMDKGYNKEMKCFTQSYESREVVDAAVLIMPLVFFIAPNDPRFLSTVEQILKPPEKGGLTSAGLVYRYNHLRSEDGKFFQLFPILFKKIPMLTSTGVGGREGSFSMCTFWLVEALTRAGAYDAKYLTQAGNLFENVLGFSNHLSMFSEEIARSGEQLGNTPQAFSHLALISAAFNLERLAR